MSQKKITKIFIEKYQHLVIKEMQIQTRRYSINLAKDFRNCNSKQPTFIGFLLCAGFYSKYLAKIQMLIH